MLGLDKLEKKSEWKLHDSMRDTETKTGLSDEIHKQLLDENIVVVVAEVSGSPTQLLRVPEELRHIASRLMFFPLEVCLRQDISGTVPRN